MEYRLIAVALFFLILVILLPFLLWRRGIFVRYSSLRLTTTWTRIKQDPFYELSEIFRQEYDRRVSILAGVVIALAVGILGYIFGRRSGGWHLIVLQSAEIRSLWVVHATIVTLGLIGLTFAWESIQNLETTPDILAEITTQLYSLEIITFLLVSNALISLGVLATSGDLVDPAFGYMAILVLLSSLAILGWSYWRVFNLILFNTLDSKVNELATQELARMKRRDDTDPNDILLEEVPEFKSRSEIFHASLKFYSENDYTDINSEDIDKQGRISDIDLRKFKKILQTADDSEILKNPLLGDTLTEDSVILRVEGDLTDEKQQEIAKHLRKGIRTL